MVHLKNNEVKVKEHLNAELQSYPFLSWGKRDKIISSFNELHFNLSLKSSWAFFIRLHHLCIQVQQIEKEDIQIHWQSFFCCRKHFFASFWSLLLISRRQDLSFCHFVNDATFKLNKLNNFSIILRGTRIDLMAFGQPECTCLNIQNVPLL